jgi:hypothetical protein
VVPQADRVVEEPPADGRGQQLPTADSDQAESAGRVPQLGHGNGEVLAGVRSRPVGIPAERPHDVGDQGRRQVTRSGELHAVSEAGEEPAVGLHDVGLRGGWHGFERGLLGKPGQPEQARAA